MTEYFFPIQKWVVFVGLGETMQWFVLSSCDASVS